MASSFRDLLQHYENLVAINNSQPAAPQWNNQQAQWDNQQPANYIQQDPIQATQDAANIFNAGQQLSEEKPEDEPVTKMRRMNALEKGLTSVRETGESLQGITGWNPEAGFTAENIMRFGASLPFQMIGGLTQAPSDLYEFATGKPVLEGDTETGYMPDEDLNALQRGASGFNSIINTFGLGIGGSARAGGALAKLGTSNKFVDQAARGVFGELFSNPVAKRVGQTAFDVAEEGTEEFVQSYLDDTRFKQIDDNSFERAIEGMKWGALGGGMASGVGQGITYAHDKFTGKTNAKQAPDPDDASSTGSAPAQDSTADYAELLGYSMDMSSMPLSNAAMREEFNRHNTLHGATSFKATNTDPRLGLGQQVGGIENLKAIYNEEQGSQKVVEAYSELGISKEQLDAALFEDEDGLFNAAGEKFKTASEAMNKLQNGVGIRSYTKRDPGLTINTSTEIVRWREGDGITVNPAFFTAFKADHDGDNATVSLVADDLNIGGNISNNLIQVESEKSNVDWSMLLSENEKLDFLKQDFGFLEQYKSESFDPMAELDAIRKAVANNEKNRDYLISLHLTNISRALDSIRAADPTSQAPSGEQFVNQFSINIGKRPGLPIYIAQQLEEEIRDITEALDATMKDMTLNDDEVKAIDGILIPQAGTVNDFTNYLQLSSALGLLSKHLGDKGNITFRQYPEQYHAALSRPQTSEFVNQFRDVVANENVVEAIIRAQFKLIQANKTKSSAIEGLFDRIVFVKTAVKYGGNLVVRSSEDEARLLNAYTEAYNEMQAVFIKAQSKETNQGNKIVEEDAFKAPIDEKNVVRNFVRTFGHAMATDILPKEAIPPQWHDLTLEQLLSKLDEDPFSPNFAMLDSKTMGAHNLFKRMRGAHGTQRVAVSSSTKNVITDPAFSDSVYNSIANEKPLEEIDKAQIALYLDGINHLLGGVIGIKAGIITPDIVGSKIGQMLISKEGNVRLRAVVGLLWRGQFIDIVDALKAKADDPGMAQRAVWALNEKKGVSPIHAQICNELADNDFAGVSETLDMLTDINNITWNDLESAFELHFKDYKGIDFFLDGFRSEVSEFDVSTVSQRVTKAKSAMAQSQKAKYETEKRIVDQIEAMHNSGAVDSNALVEWFNSATKKRRARLDTSIVAMQVYAGTKLSHEAVEKGVIQEAAAYFAEANNLVQNGRLISFVESMFSDPLGNVDRGTFSTNPYYLLTLLGDEKGEVGFLVEDYEGGGNRYLTRDILFSELSKNKPHKYNPETGPDAFDILNLLRAYPQLQGWLCEQSPQRTHSEGTTTSATVSNAYVDYKNFAENKYPKAGEDISLKLQRENYLREIENILINSPVYKEIVIRAIGRKVVGATPREVDRYVTEVHKKLLNNFYVMAMNRGGVSYLNLINENASEDASDVINDMLDRIQLAQNRFYTENSHIFGVSAYEAKNRISRSRIARRANALYGLDRKVLDEHVKSLIPNVSSSEVSEKVSSLLNLELSYYGVIADMFGTQLNTVLNFDSKYAETIADAVIEKEINGQGVNTSIALPPSVGAKATSSWMFDSNGNKLTGRDYRNAKNNRKKEIIEDLRESTDLGTTITGSSVIPSHYFRGLKTYSEPEARETIENILKYIDKIDISKDVVDKAVAKYIANPVEKGHEWNTRMLERAGQELKRLGLETNPHMLSSRSSLLLEDKGINKLLEDINASVFKDGIPGNDKRGTLKASTEFYEHVPLDFTSPEVEAVVQNNKLMDSSGFNKMEVALNGAEMKKLMGLGELNQFIAPNNSGREVTIGELRAMNTGGAIGNHHVLPAPPSNTTTVENIRTVDGILNDKLSDDTVVYYYDPDDSAHGLDSLFVPEAPPDGQAKYHRGPRLLFAIVGQSMEAMVLKNKKTMQSRERLAQNHRSASFSNLVKSGNAQQLQQDLLKGLKGYRRNIARLFAEDFEDPKVRKDSRLGDMGWGYEEALILSQMITPGVTVSLSDGSKVVIDASYIFGSQDAFNAKMQEITNNGELTAIDFRVLSVSPRTVSSRAMRKSSQEYKKSNSRSEAKEAASNSVNDWSDFALDTMSIHELLGGVNSIGRRFDFPIVAEATPSEMQLFVEEMFGGRYGAAYRPPGAFRFRDYMMPSSTKAKNSYQQYKILTEQLTGDKEDLAIVRVFGEIDKKADKTGAMQNLANTGYNYASTPDNPIGAFVLDEASLPAAIKWAEQTNGDLLIDRSISIPPKYQNYVYGNTSYTTPPANYKGQYLWLKTNEARGKREIYAGSFQDSLTPVSQNSVTACFVDIGNNFAVGDAEIRVNPDGNTEFLTKNSGCKFFDLTSLFNGEASISPVRVIGKDEVDAAKAAFDADQARFVSGSVVYQSSDSSSIDAKARDLDQFFRASISKDGVVERNATHGQIVALAAADTPGGTIYAPIYLPSTASENTTAVRLVTEGSRVALAYSGKMGIHGKDFAEAAKKYAKGSISGEAFKGIMMLADTGEDFPVLGNGTRVDLMINSEVEKGRLGGGKLDTLKAELFHYLSLKLGLSAIYKDGNLTDHIANQLTPEQQTSFLRNEPEVWDLFESGEKTLFENDPIANSAARKIISVAKLHGQACTALFSSTYPDGSIRAYDLNHQLYYGNGLLTEKELYALFSHFEGPALGNLKLCRNTGKVDEGSFDFLVNEEGNVLVIHNRIGKGYYPVRMQVTGIIGDFSEAHVPSGKATWSMQQRYGKGLQLGYTDNEFARMVEYSDMLLENGIPEYFGNLRRVPSGKEEMIKEWTPADNSLSSILAGSRTMTYSEAKTLQEINKRAKTITFQRTLVEKDGSEEVDIDNPENHRLIKDAVDDLNKRLGSNFGYKWLQSQANRGEGFTVSDNSEHNKCNVNIMRNAIDRLAYNIETKGIPVANAVKNGQTENNRYALAWLTPEEIDMWWDDTPKIKEYWEDKGGKQGFEDAVLKNARECYDQIKHINEKDRGKYYKLAMAYEYDASRHGVRLRNGRVWGTVYVEDIARSNDVLLNALDKGEQYLSIDKDLFMELSGKSKEVISDLAEYGNSTRNRINIWQDHNGDTQVTFLQRDGETINVLLNNATQLSKVMAMLNPGVFVSNIADRGVHQGIMKFAMRLGHSLHLSPYQSKHWINQNIVREAVNEPFFMKLFSAHRLAKLSGEEAEFFAGMENAENVDEWLSERLSKMSPFQRRVAQVYDIFTGGNALLKNNMDNFINRFVMFVEEDSDQAAIWLKEVARDDNGKPVTYLEQRLKDGAGAWYHEIINGSSRSTPSFVAAMQAENSAATGDMAQRNALVMLFQHATANAPLPKFLVTTTMMRFPEYTLNVSGRMLNWIIPMSSISYVFTEQLAGWGRKQDIDPHFELAQVHRSLREAMLVDITHFGVGITATILVGLAGGVEPPEDEKKWGNPEEWLICGIRAREAWWLEDILGMALPLATFTRSCQLGKPRFDLLFNGLNQACYNNPIAKISDVVGILAEPEGMFVNNYLDAVEDYADAKGGSPSYGEWLLGQAANFGLSWAGQFFTPSIVKQFYREAQEFEASYKRVYKESNTGVLNEEGEQGATEKTTYLDAMVRRATRYNPVLGMLVNLAVGGNSKTGYLAHQMPDVLYYDDYQREQAEYWSIEGLSDAEAQAKLLEIITVMQSTDDMSELRATGFYLDTYTKAALSSMVWDTINEFDEWKNELQREGKLDYYYLGNGDFSYGQQVKGEIDNIVNTNKQAWTDFYYDKVRSSVLSEPMVVYKRYNTDYYQDENGDFYATGYRRQFSSLLPFNVAPGTIDNPEGTAGYENDWVTLSAVTGQPMEGKRALVPIEGARQDWPDLEYWSGDGNGNGKSNLFKTWYGSGDGSLRATPDGSTGSAGGLNTLSNIKLPDGIDLTRDADDTSGSGSKKKNTKSTGGSGGYARRSGGGSGYRRSGGSGGSGAPNIYSHLNAPNLSNPDTMRGTRVYDADYDALRPDFQTKGSREAYKRSDI